MQFYTVQVSGIRQAALPLQIREMKSILLVYSLVRLSIVFWQQAGHVQDILEPTQHVAVST